jgi:hypothetical protein
VRASVLDQVFKTMRAFLTMRRPLRIALWVTLGVLGLWLAQFLLPAKRVIPPHVTVSFLGYTNAPPGMTSAVFGITNRADSAIKLWNGCPVEIEGSRLPLPSTTPFLEAALGRGEGMVAVIGSPTFPPRITIAMRQSPCNGVTGPQRGISELLSIERQSPHNSGEETKA